MQIEFIAFSHMFYPSRWPGCRQPAVQFTNSQAIYQPVVIPAKAGIQAFLKAFWIPACVGMTDQQFFEKGNLDKTDLKVFTSRRRSWSNPSVPLTPSQMAWSLHSLLSAPGYFLV